MKGSARHFATILFLYTFSLRKRYVNKSIWKSRIKTMWKKLNNLINSNNISYFFMSKETIHQPIVFHLKTTKNE